MPRVLSIWKLVADLSCLVCVSLPSIVLHTMVQPTNRGFFCNDASIRLPLKPDTVSSLVLGVVTFVVATLTITVCECLRIWWIERHSLRVDAYEIAGRCVHRLIVRLYTYLGHGLFGALANQLMTDTGKHTVGRLRPHFWDVCRPEYGTCNSTSEHHYIRDVICTGDDDSLIAQARLSFPSGHASLSFYVAVYAVALFPAKLFKDDRDVRLPD